MEGLTPDVPVYRLSLKGRHGCGDSGARTWGCGHGEVGRRELGMQECGMLEHGMWGQGGAGAWGT